MMSYYQAWKDRTQQIPDFHVPRKDSVKILDILLSFSREAEGTFDIGEWKKENLTWLEETFSVAPDKRSNVLSVVYHADEEDPHCHAVVVPITPEGRLNAKYFVNGYGPLSGLQDAYADRMSRFGLERSRPDPLPDIM